MQTDNTIMDVFFIIASIYGVVVGTLLCIVLWRVLKLLGEVKEAKENILSFVGKWRNVLKNIKK